MDFTTVSVVCNEVESSNDDAQQKLPETIDEVSSGGEETMEADEFVVEEDDDEEEEGGEGNEDENCEDLTLESEIVVEEDTEVMHDTETIHEDEIQTEENIQSTNVDNGDVSIQECPHAINCRLRQALLELSERQALLEEFLELEKSNQLERFHKNREHLIDMMGFGSGTDDVNKFDGKRSINSSELRGLLRLVKYKPRQPRHPPGYCTRSEIRRRKKQRKRERKELLAPPPSKIPKLDNRSTPKPKPSKIKHPNNRSDNTRHTERRNVLPKNNSTSSASSNRNISGRAAAQKVPRTDITLSKNSRRNAGTRNSPPRIHSRNAVPRNSNLNTTTRNDSRKNASSISRNDTRKNSSNFRIDSRNTASISRIGSRNKAQISRNDSRNTASTSRNDYRNTASTSRNDSRNTASTSRNDSRNTASTSRNTSRNDLSRIAGSSNEIWNRAGPWETTNPSNISGYSSSIPIWEHQFHPNQSNRFMEPSSLQFRRNPPPLPGVGSLFDEPCRKCHLPNHPGLCRNQTIELSSNPVSQSRKRALRRKAARIERETGTRKNKY